VNETKKIRPIADEERSKAVGRDASEYVCGPAGCYPGQPCRPLCYMTEMTAQGWQQCPSLHIREKTCPHGGDWNCAHHFVSEWGPHTECLIEEGETKGACPEGLLKKGS